MSMSKRALRLCMYTLLAVTGLFFGSCTGHIGYGVINWAVPEQQLSAGDLVPVFIQSNIGKVYVIGLPSGKRCEIPLWQLTLYKSKSKARKAAAGLKEYRYTYANVKLDGLPMRALPENTARQVYRLKAGQKIKILRMGQGTPVLAGNEPLEGNWFEVMADDGSTGWCFSYNLALYDEREASGGVMTVAASGPDPVLENVLARSWYPDLYRTMIQSNHIDIGRINPAWGFFPGKDSGIARLETPDGVLSFPYTGIAKTEEGTYGFTGSSLIVQAHKSESIMVQYTDADGMPQAIYYSSLDATPEQLIKDEKARRDGILADIRSAGPRFASGNYGVLQFMNNGRFLWSGYQLLSPTIIPTGAGSGGAAEIRCFLSDALAADYTGVISFRFESTNRWIHFLYRLTPQGLRLESVGDSNITDAVVLSRDFNPTIVFFNPDNSQGGQ